MITKESRGIVPCYKPRGISSYDVIRRIKRIIGKEKIGHGGTLDPFAEGVLVIGIGREGTKQLSTILKNTLKTYQGTMVFGASSTTGDPEGVITQEENFVMPSKEAIEEACKKFIGEIWQTPPIYSAVKLQGQPAYARARRGEEIKLQPKQVLVKEIKILNIENNCHSERSQSVAKNPSADRIPSESRGILHFATAPFRMTKVCLPRVKIEVTCGSGVYIRALARDIAERLGTKGYLEELIRTRIWNPENEAIDFKITDCSVVEKY